MGWELGAGIVAGMPEMRWGLGWAGFGLGLKLVSHKAAKPWVGCWPDQAAGCGRAGLSWAGCWMGKACWA